MVASMTSLQTLENQNVYTDYATKQTCGESIKQIAAATACAANCQSGGACFRPSRCLLPRATGISFTAMLAAGACPSFPSSALGWSSLLPGCPCCLTRPCSRELLPALAAPNTKHCIAHMHFQCCHACSCVLFGMYCLGHCLASIGSAKHKTLRRTHALSVLSCLLL